MLAAMARELRPLVRARSLRPVDGGTVQAWRAGGVAAAVVGVGPAAARRGTRRALEVLEPGAVLVTGMAGALSGDLVVGDVVVPEAVVDVAAGTLLVPHGETARRRGRLLTLARVGDPAPAGALGTGAVAADLETAAIGAVCEEAGIPWDVRRAVSDTPGTLDPAIAALLRADGRVDVTALVRLLARRPAAAVTLARLGRDARRAVLAATRAVLAELALREGGGDGA